MLRWYHRPVAQLLHHSFSRSGSKIMSEENEAVDAKSKSCCACCGITEVDDIKLVPCDDCDLVKYCSDECKEHYKSEHDEDCKKRAAELRDALLFKQPESSHLGDCPICMIPLPIDLPFVLNSCCCKIICQGCEYANRMRQDEMRLQKKCPFCREAFPKSKNEVDKRMMKRIEMNDPEALRHEGGEQYHKGEYSTAFAYFSKAAELGDAEAHAKLANLYHEGKGVDKDEGKEIYHLEEAAIGGHPIARRLLGCKEVFKGHDDRAVKHYIIAATQGDDGAIKMLMSMFKRRVVAKKDGLIDKEVLAAALRAHQAAVDATRSAQRDAAEEFHRKN